MNASKEKCREAFTRLTRLYERTDCGPTPREDFRAVEEFLAAAALKLPSEAAYAQDQRRRKQPKGGKAVPV